MWQPCFGFKCYALSRVQLFATSWTIAQQPPLSMEFSRQEHWSGLPFPSPGDLPDPGTESRSFVLQADSLPCEPPTILLQNAFLVLLINSDSTNLSESRKALDPPQSALCVTAYWCLLTYLVPLPYNLTIRYALSPTLETGSLTPSQQTISSLKVWIVFLSPLPHPFHKY